MDNSTLNIVNIEIFELKEKQLTAPLNIVDMKKLESLLKMRQTLHSTPELMDEHEDVDEHVFTDGEIEEFLAARKADNEKARSKAAKATVKHQDKAKAKEEGSEEVS